MSKQTPKGMQRVKIVGTIGPKSANRETIRGLIEAGLDMVRLNFSHGDLEQHRRVYHIVREESERAGVFTAVLGDLCGPKIRTGRLEGGAVTLVDGQEIVITCDDILGNAGRISTSYKELPHDVRENSRILLDDGRLELMVKDVRNNEVQCVVTHGGRLSDHKGMNIPDTPLSVSALTAKDREDLVFAKELGVDWLALSFVRAPEDVVEAKRLAGDIPVIAKIEKPEAIAALAGIIEKADGLMVARGDLGVEAGQEKVPLLQKRIIRDAQAEGIPVIVATQMMESMIENPTPTRAEVSDVANAVIDGADAVMLSGETAVGKYPIETVREMAAIIEDVESSDILHPTQKPVKKQTKPFSSAVARAAVTASEDFNLKAIAVYTESGFSSGLVSANRPRAVIVALSRHPSVLRRSSIRWGVIPLLCDWKEDSDAMVAQAEDLLQKHGIARSGDGIALAFGLHRNDRLFQTDTLKLITVR